MNFNKLTLFAFLFILFTVIGTLSHELGHIIIAKMLGYDTTLHFGSMNWESKTLDSTHDELLILIGGPLQTILTGILGLIILYKRRNRILWKSIDWLAIFLSFFWLRPVFNLIQSFINKNTSQSGSYFGGDELKIANLLSIWEGTLSLLSAAIGGLIACILIFKVIPKKFRSTFILGGIFGGLGGFILWFKWIGPILIP